jgi:fructose/tagatose bisphosphate aldolase
MSLGRKDSVMNRQRTVILFCALSKQVCADHICETELLAFAIGAFHGDYKPGGWDTIRLVGRYYSILVVILRTWRYEVARLDGKITHS